MTSKPLSDKQIEVLQTLLDGPCRSSSFDAKLVASLMRRGMVEKTYQRHPDHFLDCVGWYELKLTAKGRKASKIMNQTDKFQRKTRRVFRKWHHFNQTDLKYGECPKCGHVCQPDYDQPSEEDHVRQEWSICENCGTEFYYETTTVYRFGGFDR